MKRFGKAIGKPYAQQLGRKVGRGAGHIVQELAEAEAKRVAKPVAMTTEQIQNKLKEVIEGKSPRTMVKVACYYENGVKKQRRIWVGDKDWNTLLMKEGSKRRGQRLDDSYAIQSIATTYGETIQESPSLSRTPKNVPLVAMAEVKSPLEIADPIEKHIEVLRRKKKSWEKATLWNRIKESYAKLDLDDFRDFLDKRKPNKEDVKWGLDMYNAQREYASTKGLDLPVIRLCLTTTVKSWMPKYWPDEQKDKVTKEIKSAIEHNKEYHNSWRSNYDVSVRIQKDTKGKGMIGFLSLEFKNTGNGHYYLLLNENQAIHEEDD
jgi:hypothetical protein